MLFGSEAAAVTHAVSVKQMGTETSIQTSSEGDVQLAIWQVDNEGMCLRAWAHSHHILLAVPSVIDIKQQFNYQVCDPGIVMIIRNAESGCVASRLSEEAMEMLAKTQGSPPDGTDTTTLIESVELRADLEKTLQHVDLKNDWVIGKSIGNGTNGNDATRANLGGNGREERDSVGGNSIGNVNSTEERLKRMEGRIETLETKRFLANIRHLKLKRKLKIQNAKHDELTRKVEEQDRVIKQQKTQIEKLQGSLAKSSNVTPNVKTPPSSFVLFTQSIRGELVGAANAQASQASVRWKAMGESDKQHFRLQAAEKKQEYLVALEAARQQSSDK